MTVARECLGPGVPQVGSEGWSYEALLSETCPALGLEHWQHNFLRASHTQAWPESFNRALHGA